MIDLKKARIDLELGKRINEKGCWIWPFATNEHGYGLVSNNGKLYKVHRLSAHVYWGFDIDSPIKILHKCDTPPCFNPECLFEGTQLDNINDMLDKDRRKHVYTVSMYCPKGHEKTEENTYQRPDGGGKCCKICRNERNNIHNNLRKGKVNA